MKLEGNMAYFEKDDMGEKQIIMPEKATKLMVIKSKFAGISEMHSKIQEIDFNNVEEILIGEAVDPDNLDKSEIGEYDFTPF